MRLDPRLRARVIPSPALLLSLIALFGTLVTACARSDADLQADLQKQLSSDPPLSGTHLTATVTGRVARISGETQTRTQQARAIEIARAIKGIETIESAMHVNDAALTQAVKDAIAGDPLVSTVPLRVEVHDGEVRLFSDQTNADQRARLAQLVRAVDGVSHVEDNMR